ncbi:hypothetical protein IQ06DRAFT_289292 [Phaeosphaeriaceae sp. SRC1lsM3a]|nr:hypothetical protein IQ06DRAFT_289292 [Stagonospora sp. SRC1lsM3a]
MKTTSFATAATLLSASYAATVTLETTPCLDPSYGLEQLTIEMNLSGPVARDLNHVCGLRIISASEGVDINSISCQAFKDVVGTQPGSAVFTYAEPARIATNPVQEKGVWCTYPTVDDKVRRQIDNSTVSESVSVPVSTSASTSLRRSARSTATFSASTSSGASSASASATASTTTITTIASASSGLPSSSGNLTTPSLSRGPSPSQSEASTSPSATPGAASSISVGMGVVAAALAAMFL